MDFSPQKAPLYLIIALMAGILIGTYFLPSGKDKFSTKKVSNSSSKIEDVMSMIDYYYFESIDHDSLTDKVVSALLQSLDPHSSYVSAKDAQNYNATLMGEFEGIGISFNILNDTILVINVNTGGPSQKAGMLPGDKIIRVDGKNVSGVEIKNSEIVTMLRGKKGSEVKVEVKRHGVGKLIPIDIVRDKIQIRSIEVAYMLKPGVGYILINSFSPNTSSEFSDALHVLQKKGMTNLILDLRGNPGGTLQTAVDVCDELLGRKKLIVYTKGKAVGSQSFVATSLGDFQDENQKLVVLIDEGSASASEIVAGAVQDNDRGIIVGRRSFGKGLVQKSFPLEDSSEILLTVARYYTPAGRCIQKSFKNYDEDIINRYLRGEMSSSDSMPVADSLKFRTSKGRIVYGGGGIIPDVFVPIDTSGDYVYFNKIFRAGVLFQSLMEYMDLHREQLNNYKTFQQFDKEYVVSESVINSIIKKGEAKDIPASGATQGSKVEIKKWFKAYMARNLFGETGFCYISNQDDKMIKKAVELFAE